MGTRLSANDTLVQDQITQCVTGERVDSLVPRMNRLRHDCRMPCIVSAVDVVGIARDRSSCSAIFSLSTDAVPFQWKKEQA